MILPTVAFLTTFAFDNNEQSKYAVYHMHNHYCTEISSKEELPEEKELVYSMCMSVYYRERAKMIDGYIDMIYKEM